MNILSHAKLNWYLRVLERRDDGYHDLETIFQQLDLADELTFTAVDGNACEIEGFDADVPSDTNLITRAWQLMRVRYPENVLGLHVAAKKVIPRGGGLGGGSSNAAASLVAINEVYELGLPAHALETLGAQLGSDVPFFVRGGTAIGRGRGELLESLPVHSVFNAILVFPRESISTKVAYAGLDRMEARPNPVRSMAAIQQSLLTGNVYRLASALHNDFEVATQGERWYQRVVSALDEVGCLRAFLCGSGSTVAGLGKDNQHCLEMSERLRNILPYTLSITCTLAGRGSLVR